jgi:hypothetical protein
MTSLPSDPALLILLFFVLPLWTAAGIADWLCHRAARIAETAGWRESLFHLAMLAEAGLPLMAALFLEIDSLVILAMIVALLVHQATALWDITFAVGRREVSPVEQQVHSLLEIVPLMGIALVATLHWGQFLALFGFGDEPARFSLQWKREPLPALYLGVVLASFLLFELLPYGEELARGIRAVRRPPPAAPSSRAYAPSPAPAPPPPPFRTDRSR